MTGNKFLANYVLPFGPVFPNAYAVVEGLPSLIQQVGSYSCQRFLFPFLFFFFKTVIRPLISQGPQTNMPFQRAALGHTQIYERHSQRERETSIINKEDSFSRRDQGLEGLSFLNYAQHLQTLLYVGSLANLGLSGPNLGLLCMDEPLINMCML